MFEAGVEFLDPVQLRAPQVAEIVEAFVHRRKAPVKGLFNLRERIDRVRALRLVGSDGGFLL